MWTTNTPISFIVWYVMWHGTVFCWGYLFQKHCKFYESFRKHFYQIPSRFNSHWMVMDGNNATGKLCFSCCTISTQERFYNIILTAPCSTAWVTWQHGWFYSSVRTCCLFSKHFYYNGSVLSVQFLCKLKCTIFGTSKNRMQFQWSILKEGYTSLAHFVISISRCLFDNVVVSFLLQLNEKICDCKDHDSDSLPSSKEKVSSPFTTFPCPSSSFYLYYIYVLQRP